MQKQREILNRKNKLIPNSNEETGVRYLIIGHYSVLISLTFSFLCPHKQVMSNCNTIVESMKINEIGFEVFIYLSSLFRLYVVQQLVYIHGSRHIYKAGVLRHQKYSRIWSSIFKNYFFHFRCRSFLQGHRVDDWVSATCHLEVYVEICYTSGHFCK